MAGTKIHLEIPVHLVCTGEQQHLNLLPSILLDGEAKAGLPGTCMGSLDPPFQDASLNALSGKSCMGVLHSFEYDYSSQMVTQFRDSKKV